MEIFEDIFDYGSGSSEFLIDSFTAQSIHYILVFLIQFLGEQGIEPVASLSKNTGLSSAFGVVAIVTIILAMFVQFFRKPILQWVLFITYSFCFAGLLPQSSKVGLDQGDVLFALILLLATSIFIVAMMSAYEKNHLTCLKRRCARIFFNILIPILIISALIYFKTISLKASNLVVVSIVVFFVALLQYYSFSRIASIQAYMMYGEHYVSAANIILVDMILNIFRIIWNFLTKIWNKITGN